MRKKNQKKKERLRSFKLLNNSKSNSKSHLQIHTYISNSSVQEKKDMVLTCKLIFFYLNTPEADNKFEEKCSCVFPFQFTKQSLTSEISANKNLYVRAKTQRSLASLPS